jgi:hypothetical protein
VLEVFALTRGALDSSINEPAAAAIVYGVIRWTEHNILVYDLGGGTFEVSLLAGDNGVFGVVADNCDPHVDGEGFGQHLKVRPATCRPLCWRPRLGTWAFDQRLAGRCAGGLGLGTWASW